jgi:hypothetical protein
MEPGQGDHLIHQNLLRSYYTFIVPGSCPEESSDVDKL